MTYPLKNVDHRKDIMLEKPAPISMHLKHLISMIHEILDYNYLIEVYFILSILNCVISSKLFNISYLSLITKVTFNNFTHKRRKLQQEKLARFRSEETNFRQNFVVFEKHVFD